MPKRKLRIAMITTYPPGTGTLNEYAFHFVRAFRKKREVGEMILLVDELPAGQQYHDAGADEAETPGQPGNERVVPLSFIPCWRFNSLSNLWRLIRTVQRVKPDAVIFNIQFASFGDRKVAATLGLLAPLLIRLLVAPTVVLLHNIMETVDLKSAGFAD